MNVVVNFLSTLVSDESNGSVRRMLGLCGEFERISRVVIDKAEKDSQSKKKRKTGPEETQLPQNIPPGNRPQPQPSSAAAPAAGQQPPTTTFSPQVFPDNLGSTAPMADPNLPSTTTGLPSDLPSNVQTMPGVGQEFQDMLSPSNLAALGFPDQQAFAEAGTTPMTSFQQPFVPQDLWQMPMTIEWDWADMSNNFPVFDGGAGIDSHGAQPNQS